GITRAGRVGALLAAVVGGFFGLIAPVTIGVSGLSLIYIAPWVHLPGLPLCAAFVAFGALQWALPGWVLGRLIARIVRKNRTG
ncbi:MAG TPA: hypothetical protein VIG47_04940, partial [Gemmatimonadaceae bacterium]